MCFGHREGLKLIAFMGKFIPVAVSLPLLRELQDDFQLTWMDHV